MEEYSVLMPVYCKEQPEYFRLAAESMLNQTASPSEFLLVCDGPLPEALETEIVRLEKMWPDVFRVLRLKKNSGISHALAAGVKACRCEWIARMDSDDIACGDRCEKQLHFLMKNPQIALLGGSIAEFSQTSNIPEEVWTVSGDDMTCTIPQGNITGIRQLPGEPEEIRQFARSRNPMNHMTVMMRRSAVLSAGNYREIPGAEDYELWVRLLQAGYDAANLEDVLVYARTGNGMVRRRGGAAYVKNAVLLQRHFYRTGFLSGREALKNSLVRAGVGLSPIWLRNLIYRNGLRKRPQG